MSNVVALGHISASTAGDFLTCERLYELKHIRGFVEDESMAMHFGQVMDYAFDAYYRTRDVNAMKQEVLDRWPGDLTEELCEKGRTMSRALKICDMYADKWAHDGIEVILPAMRENVYVDIPGTRYRLAIRLDKVVRWDRTLRVMEHKTTSQLTAGTFNRYDPSIQNKLYIWAIRRITLPVQGIIAGMLMDVTCVNTQKIDFKRDVISQTQQQDKEVEDFLVQLVGDIEARTVAGRFKPNWGACSLYGDCAFRRACKMSPDIRESILQTYKRRESNG